MAAVLPEEEESKEIADFGFSVSDFKSAIRNPQSAITINPKYFKKVTKFKS